MAPVRGPGGHKGFSAVYAFPLRFGTEVIGAMNIFHRRTEGIGEADVEAAQSLADVVTIALINQRSVREAHQRADQLQHALDSRVLIEQAKGVLVERSGLDVTEAFWRIRRHSKRSHLTLREVCRRVIEEGFDPT